MTEWPGTPAKESEWPGTPAKGSSEWPGTPETEREQSTLETIGSETSRALAKANRDYLNPMLGLPMDVVGWVTGKGDLPGGKKWLNQMSRSEGVPEPETVAGKLGAGILGQGATAVTEGAALGKVVGGLGGWAMENMAAKGAAKQIADPLANLTAGVGAATGGEAAEELAPEGIKPYAKVAGSLVGGAAGGGLGTARPPTKVDQTFEAFERLGLTPTAATGGVGGKTAQWLESNVLPQAIGSANRMHKVAQNNLEQFSKVQQDIAHQFGAAKPKFQAGGEIQEAVLEDWHGRQRDAGDILNAIGKAFEDNEYFVPQNILRAVEKPFAAASTKEVQQLSNAPEIQELDQLLTKTGGVLTYADMKALKTKYGAMMAPGHDKSVNEAQIGQIVKALDDDIEHAVKSLGNPDVLKDWHYAKATYQNAMDDYRESFKKLLKAGDAPIRAERVYDILVGQAGIKSPADIESFETVWRALGKEKQGNLAATVLSHMGNKDPSKLGDAEGFSIQTFLTNYKNLSPSAKKMLFKSTGNAELEKSFDDLTMAAEKMGVWDKLASSSRSGVGAIQGMQVLGPVAAAATGDWLKAIKLMALDIGGPAIAAQVLTRPAFVKKLADTLNAANDSAVGTLRALMSLEPATIDPETGQRAKAADISTPTELREITVQ